MSDSKRVINREGALRTFDHPDGEWTLQDIGRMLFDVNVKLDTVLSEQDTIEEALYEIRRNTF